MNDIAEQAAYPTGQEIYGGLTKRELFAAMALQSLIGIRHPIDVANLRKDLAWESVEIADALIAELAKDTK